MAAVNAGHSQPGSNGYLGNHSGPQRVGKRPRQSEVVDLTTPSDDDYAAGATVAVRSHLNALSCRFNGAKLSDFEIGERLGATRDGRAAFQGCNSRVFRATFRRQDNAKSTGHPLGDTPPSAESSSGGAPNSTTMRQRGIRARDFIDIGERVWKGSFGALAFGGARAGARSGIKNTAASDEAPDSGKGVEVDGQADTKWALKMALTLAGQDPHQAAREMEVEVAILVGGRISPHANIMRGVHSFQDEIGRDLRPKLWAGLDGDVLCPSTYFVVMPLFTAGSLQALLNKRRLRCEGPPFLRLLDMMRFVEQMLSAVCHLLDHGIAHNDIKPDNWLLRSDHRTLVLTDFGAAVDFLRPNPRTCSLSSPEAPTPHSGAANATAAAATGVGIRTTDVQTPSPCRSPDPANRAVDTAAAESGSSGVGTESAPPSAAPRWHAAANPFVSISERSNGQPSSGAGTGGDAGGANRATKRRRCCVGEQSDVGGVDHRVGAKPYTCYSGLSEQLVLPFSKYCVVGTPSIVAPELARAWREETVLDFRRSDVFSVGVCMYRMLRAETGYIDNGTGLERKGPVESIEGRFDQQSWPLSLFPEDKGGCPLEVSQLCRGLLQADPSQRHAAPEGKSLVSWFVSRLESADRQSTKKPSAGAPTCDAVVWTSGHEMKSTTASCGGGDGLNRGRPIYEGGDECRVMGRGSFRSTGGTIGSLVGMNPFELNRTISIPLSGGSRVSESGRDLGDAGAGEREERWGLARECSSRVSAARKSSEEERRLEAPDELVRCDRISQMRDFFPSASPDTLNRELHSRDWDVACACADFDDTKKGEGSVRGARPGADLERFCAPGESANAPSTPESQLRARSGGVAEELRGPRWYPFPPHLRRPFHRGNPRQMYPPLWLDR